MKSPNPYAPPVHGARDIYANADSTDVYIDTLPTQALRVAGVSAILTGIVVLFMCLRLALAVIPTPVFAMLEGLLALIGAAHFAIAWGVTGGKTWLLVAGMVFSPFVGLASLFVLLTGSLAGAMGMVLAVLNFVLLATNIGAVRKIAVANAAMKRLARLEASAAAEPLV